MRVTLGVLQTNLLLVLFFALVLNWPVFLHFYTVLSALTHVKAGFAISIPLVLIAALNAVFIPFTFRFVLKPFFTVLILTGSIVSYAMLKYGVIFDAGMIQNIVETNSGEAGAYLNGSVALWFLLTGLLPVLVLWSLRIRYPARWYQGLAWRAGVLAISLLFIGGIAALYYQDYASVGRNNKSLAKEIVPANYVHGLYKYGRDVLFATPIPYQQLGTDARVVARGSKPTLMFLVVGETARSQNYSLNGYGKATNSFTAKEQGVVSFRDVRSCGTATAVSVPCMFSNLTRRGYDDQLASSRDGLLDVLQHAGVSVLWKENDGGCKGVCRNVPTIEILPKSYPALCQGESCYDEVLLEGLDQQIAGMKGNKLVAFHLMGSHGPTYFRRYPASERAFMPDCPRSDIENCSNEELVNTYDNTIRYTDKVVGLLIDKLKSLESQYDVGLVYLSDHGESLGAMGLYLHGTPYKFAPDDQTRVPLLTWFSPQLQADRQLDMGCLAAEASSQRFSHDNLFHSMLGIMDVQTRVYDNKLDLFKPCRAG
ncbi:phosphoethanolamine transferase [Aeromonas veronii]|uniref:phosphoethanolamine transferase n=1 Tax=Aeromonas veronii TaxID=654 RepID=UPI0018815303|nr:phosphoethanolamine--lipid A transferase [Aeromonas veronii]MBE8735336.1 phosphoethanolamine--lipid A transferase [Aeromonas veronii]MBE8739285.1 phosphoethanolamine--lipid A transferase [Aeromonas veronii]MBE8742760.1 phosphoethanolamine--lipid A transferase [Aeromonas veronii]MBE8762687.1 phosphoethanolamine--lipid A transferase [Aeromonas veronii]MBE8838309.1 phosphoethanolamine--lipid A transferase [Aeromonas veronii]